MNVNIAPYYKKIQKSVSHIKSSSTPPLENYNSNNIHHKFAITTPVLNSQHPIKLINNSKYSSRNFSSIKSIIKRIQASGNTKINYPRIKTKNERPDIFLQGGQINKIQKYEGIGKQIAITTMVSSVICNSQQRNMYNYITSNAKKQHNHKKQHNVMSEKRKSKTNFQHYNKSQSENRSVNRQKTPNQRSKRYEIIKKTQLHSPQQQQQINHSSVVNHSVIAVKSMHRQYIEAQAQTQFQEFIQSKNYRKYANNHRMKGQYSRRQSQPQQRQSRNCQNYTQISNTNNKITGTGNQSVTIPKINSTVKTQHHHNGGGYSKVYSQQERQSYQNIMRTFSKQIIGEEHYININKNKYLESNGAASSDNITTQSQRQALANDKKGFVSLKLKDLQDLSSNNYQFNSQDNLINNLLMNNDMDRVNHLIMKKKSLGTQNNNKQSQSFKRSPISQNVIKAVKRQSKKQKMPSKSINVNINANINVKQKQKQKKIIQVNIAKPLFYLSGNEIKQMRITAKNFIVTQYPSGQIITGSYFKQVTQIASLTKIVTFYGCLVLAEKYQLNFDQEKIVIDQQVESISGTSAELFQGDQYTVNQLFHGLMLPSGNDAALALAKWGGKILLQKQQNQSLMSDSESKTGRFNAFMNYLNQLCSKIGMKASYFGNPHGLPHPKSGTTAQDMAILINKALVYPFFRNVIKTKIFKYWINNRGQSREVVWENTNKLLRRKGFTGIKTGVTVTAGPCLATCYEMDDKIYTVILLKTSKLSKRFKETRWLLGKCLSKICYKGHQKQIKSMLRNDPQFDSDNSQEENQFNYQRNDAQQMKKRMKIITYEM